MVNDFSWFVDVDSGTFVLSKKVNLLVLPFSGNLLSSFSCNIDHKESRDKRRKEEMDEEEKQQDGEEYGMRFNQIPDTPSDDTIH